MSDRLLGIARRVADRLSPDEGVRALFLAGSFGAGTQDAWSDLDLVAVAEPERHEPIADAFAEAVGGVSPVVMRRRRLGRTGLVNLVTEGWDRCDLFLAGTDDFLAQKRARDRLRPLIDRDGLHARLPETLPPAAPDPKRVAFIAEEFIRVLGLLPVGLGRGELVLLTTGAGLLRDLLRDLMLETCPLPDRGGMLHLGRLLTTEQMAMLESLPYPRPDREEAIAAHLATAAAFLPLARRMTTELDLPWPAAFEAAMRANLRRAGVILE